MLLRLAGGCPCGAVRFGPDSPTPHLDQLCDFAICRKTAGSSGSAITIMDLAASFHVAGDAVLGDNRAPMPDGAGGHASSRAQRHLRTPCVTALWLFDPEWPELIHPQASAIDTPAAGAPRPHLHHAGQQGALAAAR